MSSSEEQFQQEAQGESIAEADELSRDAHVDQDVCVAALSWSDRARRGRRRDRSWMAAIVISVACHMALAAVCVKWYVGFEPPVFSIGGGRGGTPGAGTTDDDPAVLASARLDARVPEMNVGATAVGSMEKLEDEADAPPAPAATTEHPLNDLMSQATEPAMIGRGEPVPVLRASRRAAGGFAPSEESNNAKPKAAGDRVEAPAKNGDDSRATAGTGGGGDGKAIIAGLSSSAANDPPEYPRDALRRGKQGTVLLELLVDASGRVHVIKILQSSGEAMLDESAWRKVDTYVVPPGREGGMAVETMVKFPVRFVLPSYRR